MMITNTPKSVDVNFADHITPAIGILKLVVYIFICLAVLFVVAYIEGCSGFGDIAENRYTDAAKAQADIVKYISKAQEAKVKVLINWAKNQNEATQGLVLGMLLSDRSLIDMAEVVDAVHKPPPMASEIFATGFTRDLVPLGGILTGTILGIKSVNAMRDVAAGVSAGQISNYYNRSNNVSQGPQNVDTGNTYNINQPEPTTSTATGTATVDFDFRTVQEPAR